MTNTIPTEMAGYQTIRVAKGALIYECQLCGCVVLHPIAHDAWHREQRATSWEIARKGESK